MGDTVSAENLDVRYSRLSQEGPPGSVGISPRLVSGGDRVERDHVHLPMVIPSKYAVSKVVEILRSVTSRQLEEKFPRMLSKVYWDDGRGWARGFFTSTVGINEATIRQHVQHQGEQKTG